MSLEEMAKVRLVQTEDHMSTEAETWCGHKPRKASSHQQIEETNDVFSPRVSRGTVLCQCLADSVA